MSAERLALHAESSSVVAALRAQNPAPALEWCAVHRDRLKEMGSELEFKLRALAFITVLEAGHR